MKHGSFFPFFFFFPFFETHRKENATSIICIYTSIYKSLSYPIDGYTYTNIHVHTYLWVCESSSWTFDFWVMFRLWTTSAESDDYERGCLFSWCVFFSCYYFNNWLVTFSLKYWGMLLNFWTVDALNSLCFYDCYLIQVVQVYNYFSYCTNIFLKPSKFKNILCFMRLYDYLSWTQLRAFFSFSFALCLFWNILMLSLLFFEK